MAPALGLGLLLGLLWDPGGATRGHLRLVFRGAKNENSKAEAQAELSEDQIPMVAVKRRNREDTRSIQEEMNLHRERGDLQKQVFGRVAATPVKKLSVFPSLQNFNEKLRKDLQGAWVRMKTRKKRLEDDMKIVQEEMNLPQEQEALENPISTGSVTQPGAAAELFNDASNPQPRKWRLSSTCSSSVAAAAQKQETEEKNLKLLRKMVNMGNPMKKYMQLGIIGSGTFGKVCRALDIAAGIQVAIRKINLHGLKEKELKVNELMFMKKNSNPNLVNYLDSYLVGEQFWLVMEYMDGGSLSDALSKSSLLEDEAATVSRECLQGLDFLHVNHVIHQNVKTSNILFTTDGSVKLADFGLFAQLSPEQSRRSSVASTSGWMAPEVLAGQPYGPKADIWSFGIVGIEMVEGVAPYCDETPVSPQHPTATGGRPKLRLPYLFSPELQDFLCCCLQTDDAQRWSAKELLQHPFVASAKRTSCLLPLIASRLEKKRKEEI